VARTITVSEEAYQALRRLKREGESFSQLILRLVREAERRRRLSSLAGAWGDVGEEEARRMLEEARRELGRGWRA